MDIVVPYSHIKSITKLTWCEIMYGIEEGYVDFDIVYQHASYIFQNSHFSNNAIAKLMTSNNDRESQDYIIELAEEELEYDPMKISEKWLYIILSWIYNERYNYDDPIGHIEYIYEIFNSPAELTPIVMHTPSNDPHLDEPEKYHEKIYKLWNQIIIDKELKFKIS